MKLPALSLFLLLFLLLNFAQGGAHVQSTNGDNKGPKAQTAVVKPQKQEEQSKPAKDEKDSSKTEMDGSSKKDG